MLPIQCILVHLHLDAVLLTNHHTFVVIMVYIVHEEERHEGINEVQ